LQIAINKKKPEENDDKDSKKLQETTATIVGNNCYVFNEDVALINLT
jgi:hypothetical protein